MRTLTLLVTTTVLAADSWVFAQGPNNSPVSTTSLSPVSAQPAQGPGEIVTAAASGMLKELDADRDSYRKNSSKVNDLVQKYLLTHFDTQTAAQAVLGKHWRAATPEQRKRFVDAFYRSLLNSYSSALVDFTSDRLQILPVNVDPNADHATVRTLVKRNDGERVAVNYQMRRVNNDWKAWDVNVAGISYIKSYHDDFGPQIEQQGLDSVIARLERGGGPGPINKTITGGKD